MDVTQSLPGVTAATVGAWVPVDIHRDTFSVGYAVFHASGPGQVSGDIQGTLDNPEVISSVRAFQLVTANPSTGLVQDGVITQPVMAIRYKVGVVSASSNIVFQLLQSGD